jgi:hypothetical protein
MFPVVKDGSKEIKRVLYHFPFIRIQVRFLMEQLNHDGRSPDILRYFESVSLTLLQLIGLPMFLHASAPCFSNSPPYR